MFQNNFILGFKIILHTFNPISLPQVFLPCSPCKKGYYNLPPLFKIWCDPKAKKHHIHEGPFEGVVEWPPNILWMVLKLPSYNNTPKSTCGLREKFEDTHLNKPPSTDSSFRVGRGAIVPRS